jgi:hypothetical protein
MVGQVKVVGILMIVHGITVAIMGVLYAALFSASMFGVLPRGGGVPRGGGGPPVMEAIIIAVGTIIFTCGILNAVAGYRVMTFRNRVLGLIALFTNLVPLITCYCAPTSIAMMVYGLIVLFQPDVARAFQLVAGGATPDEAIRKFTRRYDDVRDNEDDRSSSRRKWEDDRRRRREADDDLRLEDDPEAKP